MSAPAETSRRLTESEVDEIAGQLCRELFADPKQAAIIAKVVSRRMNAAPTLDEQTRAGGSALHLFASLGEPS